MFFYKLAKYLKHTIKYLNTSYLKGLTTIFSYRGLCIMQIYTKSMFGCMNLFIY